MTQPIPALPPAAPPPAPVAGWLSSLRVRLAIAVTLTVIVTVGGTGWLALRVSEQALVDEVRSVAVGAAERAVDEIELLPDPLDPRAVTEALREIESVTAEVETISVITIGSLLVATSGLPPGEAGVSLAVQSAQDALVLVLTDRGMLRAAAPIRRDGVVAGAVMVRANLAAVIALQQLALRRIAGFAVLAALGLVVLVDLVARRLIYTPIHEIRSTMARVAGGDLSARAPVRTQDELADVAAGLNEMLGQMEHFNDSLQARVREATQEIRARNEQIVDGHGRVFALREQLASAEQLAAVGQTAANVAHQVGTPLNLISGYVQLLKEQLPGDSPLLPRLAIIEEQAGKVATTVRTLLDRSRRIGPRTEIAAQAVLARVIEAVRPRLDPADVALTLETPQAPLVIVADVTSLELALLNLMTNAADAMPDGGTLAVRLSAPSATIARIEIEDSGHGIPDDLLPRIFEAWVSTKGPGRGTGLGLAITRDVVQAHGGTIGVVTRIGRGTTFTIELPAVDPDQPEETAAS